MAVKPKPLQNSRANPPVRALDRYLAEFDFHQNYRAKPGYSDAERADKILQGIEGKRLTYRRTDKEASSALA
jgi:hypothetical protein